MQLAIGSRIVRIAPSLARCAGSLKIPLPVICEQTARHSICILNKRGIREGQLAVNNRGGFQGVRALSGGGESTMDAPEVSLVPACFPNVVIGPQDVASWSGDLLVVGVYEDGLEKTNDVLSIKASALQALDARFGGAITDVLSMGQFRGKPGSSSFVRVGSKEIKYLGIVGLGPIKEARVVPKWGVSVYQTLGEAVANGAKDHRVKTAGVVIPSCVDTDQGGVVGKVAVGVWLGGYEATRFKQDVRVSPLDTVSVLGLGKGDAVAGESAVTRSEGVARGVLLARYLVEAPPNVCTPAHLVKAAEGIAEEHSDVMKLEVLEKEDCAKLKMGCYLAVAENSDLPPKFIHLTYTPATGPVNKKVGLVGKGLTFDSGGYNLKVAGGIETMKIDMGGCGATLGAAKIIGALKPPGVEVHFIVAACENMISGRAYRPGDVLTASNGKTVEVINTDAEGRLTLADALVFAQEQCVVECLVDSATLTGAKVVALGNIGGLFTPSDEMAECMCAAGKEAGEKLWRMPLEQEFLEDLKSPIADLKNVGGRSAGSITAGLFLKEFVDVEKVDWAHLDIAGCVWNDKKGGATGYGAAMLAEYAIAQGKSK